MSVERVIDGRRTAAIAYTARHSDCCIVMAQAVALPRAATTQEVSDYGR